MKKIIRLIILVIMVIPFMAKADMGAPVLRSFDAIITTDRGIKCTKYSDKSTKILQKGDHVDLLGELDWKGENVSYGASLNNYEYICDRITINDFIPADAEVKPTDSGISDAEEDVEILIYAENGVDVYKGPDIIYEKVGHLDKDIKLTYRYYLDGESGIIYVYVDYNGIKGWVKTTPAQILWYIKPGTEPSFIVTQTNNICGGIPRNTLLTPKYVSDRWSSFYIYGYNDCEFTSDQHNGEIARYGYDEMGELKVLKDIKVYEYADMTSKQLGTLKPGENFDIMSIVWGESDYKFLYVTNSRITGWIYYDETSFKYADDDYTATTTTQVSTTRKDWFSELFTTTEENANKENSSTEKKSTTKDIIIISSIVGGVVALTAIVVIVLINKKKKNNNTVVEFVETNEGQTNNEVPVDISEQTNITDVNNKVKEDNNEKNN